MQNCGYLKTIRPRQGLGHQTCFRVFPPATLHGRLECEEGGRQAWHGKTACLVSSPAVVGSARENGLMTVNCLSLCAVCCCPLAVRHFCNRVCNAAKQAQSICFKIQCDQYLQTAAKDATGERAAGLQALASTLTGQGITVSNIVDYMSLIEQRSIQVR